MRPIDAGALLDILNGLLLENVHEQEMIERIIKDAPTIDLAEDLREKVISNMAEMDFVHVIRCQKCEQYRESQVFGWCDRYDEPKMKLSFCSEGKVRPSEKA